MNRRLFIARFTKGTTAIAALAVVPVACSTDSPADSTSTTSAASTTGPTTSIPGATSTAPTTTATPASTAVPEGGATVSRIDLGFVSAYVLSRDGEAAVVDTGVSGSADQIQAGLMSIGLGWDNVAHVIVTHLHGDHVGSLSAVLDAAPTAVGYAGAGDADSISSPRPLTSLADGDRVFDLDIIATPGHTPGHIAVYDSIGGTLIAGDAMNGGDALGGSPGTVAGANPQFTPDIQSADDSIRKLAQLTFGRVFFGHGSPVLVDADEAVMELAASL